MAHASPELLRTLRLLRRFLWAIGIVAGLFVLFAVVGILFALVSSGDGEPTPGNDVHASPHAGSRLTGITEAGLNVTQLSNKSGNARNPQFQEVAFELRATGTMGQLTEFLYRFYSSPHLHRISSATILAEDAGKKLSVTATATALVRAVVVRAAATTTTTEQVKALPGRH